MSSPGPDTLIDQVNHDDFVVGQMARGSALDSGEGFRTAHVLLFNGHQILLQRLAPGRDRHAGRLGSSVAAYLYAGESYEEAAVRRLREELGVVRPLHALGKIRFFERNTTKFVTAFEAHATEATICEPVHIAEIEWWDVEDLSVEARAQPEAFTPTLLGLLGRFWPAIANG